MSNANITICQLDNLQLEGVVNCPNCSEELKEVKSKTNSVYYYCECCNDDKETVLKNLQLDFILKDIQNVISNIEGGCKDIKININKQSDNIIELNINNEFISKNELSYSLTEKNIKSFNNTILDLIEDTFGEGSKRPLINISI